MLFISAGVSVFAGAVPTINGPTEAGLTFVFLDGTLINTNDPDPRWDVRSNNVVNTCLIWSNQGLVNIMPGTSTGDIVVPCQ